MILQQKISLYNFSLHNLIPELFNMNKNLENYLIEAAQVNKSQISVENPYCDIGFDRGSGRLGWVREISFSQIQNALMNIMPLFEGKKNFVFIGMGGSINGIKPLLTLLGGRFFYTLDSLDPQAISEVADKIKDLKETLIIAISKSGTTKETQLLALTLKELFSAGLGRNLWINHFLWLSDSTSFEKLDALGWKGVKKAQLQFDGETDIGGRFSSPHTLIFFLPLFLLLNKDFSQLKKLHDTFASLRPEIRKSAYLACCKYKDKPNAYFSPLIGELDAAFSSWIVQLFQESLGSKLDNLEVKTIPNISSGDVFFPLKLDMKIDNPVVSLIIQMYFFQVFIAYYSAQKGVNFVTQSFVEKYKQQMRKLEDEGAKGDGIKPESLENIMRETKKLIRPGHRFIEIVLYFYPQADIKEMIKKSFGQEFPGNQLLMFIGSDWNHQSYQAAFGSKDTFFVLLTASSYRSQVGGISSDTLSKNVETLQVVAEATYLTLKDKSILRSVKI